MFLRAFIVLDLCLCSVFCQGQPQLIGSSQPIVATVGDDVILPCLYNPARDVSGLTLEWSRPDLNPRFVFVWRSSDELKELKHPQFTGRTVLFTDELKHGNISLKLRKVQPSDEGTYRCFLPTMGLETTVRLNVVVTSSWAHMSVAAVDGWRAAVVLQCESRGWYPEPELLWLDSEGRPLSADPTQTHRRPDGLYNGSSRVTVEQSHGSTFTCRVSESSTNQSTHTSLQVSDEFFTVNRCVVTVIVTVVAVCSGIIIVVILTFIRWKRNYSKYQSPGDLEAEAVDESHDLVPLQTQTQTQTQTYTDTGTETGTQTQTQTQTYTDTGTETGTQTGTQTETYTDTGTETGTQTGTQTETYTETERLQQENESIKAKLEFIIKELNLFEEKRESTILIDSVDPKGKNIRLRNKSNKQATSLLDWTVTIVIDFSETFVYNFSRFNFKTESTVTIWAEGCGPQNPLDTDLEWTDQSPWNTGRIVFVSLYNRRKQLVDKTFQGMKSDSK